MNAFDMFGTASGGANMLTPGYGGGYNFGTDPMGSLNGYSMFDNQTPDIMGAANMVDPSSLVYNEGGPNWQDRLKELAGSGALQDMAGMGGGNSSPGMVPPGGAAAPLDALPIAYTMPLAGMRMF